MRELGGDLLADIVVDWLALTGRRVAAWGREMLESLSVRSQISDFSPSPREQRPGW